jgi:hypothetical protein
VEGGYLTIPGLLDLTTNIVLVDFKKFIPHLIAAGILLLTSMAFFAPNAFQGKVLSQGDNDKARGIQTEIKNYMAKGEPGPLWTNSQFGGMPSFQIYAKAEPDLIRPFTKTTFLWCDVSSVWAQVFAAMLMMYLFLTVLKVDWRVALFGALGYGITSYNVDILEAGHSTKMAALVYTPVMLAAAVLLFRKKWLYGGGLLALLTAMQVYVNHIQITYYTLMIMAVYYAVELVAALRSGDMINWLKAAGIAVFAVGLGVATNTGKLWSTQEYAEETIRGGSSLPSKAADGKGLTKKYAFDWSYGVCESMTLMVPHAAGGGANEKFKDTKLYKALAPEQRNGIGGLFYNGAQPFVGTAIYFGAVLCFLGILGAILARNRYKWWLLISGLLMVSIAWGGNFFLNYIFFDYLPMFNKFRAVTMSLGLGQFCFAALGAIGLSAYLSDEFEKAQKQKALYIATGAAVLLCLVAFLCASSTGPNDDAISPNAALYKLLQEDRSNLLSGDVYRSIGFILVGAGLLFLYNRGTLKASVTAIAIASLSLIDNWGICSRTIYAEKYTAARSVTTPPAPQAFDKQILQDKDIHYRVLDLARGSITGNGTNSYFHKSINGYHAAKLQRFQEVNEKYLGEKLNESLHILGMMNTKYIIAPGGKNNEPPRVIPNPLALGHAWFVKNYQVVADADTELDGLGTLNPKDTALILQSFAGALNGFQIQPDSAAAIDLIAYHPDKMEYIYTASTDQLAVFPEQYYPPAKGWKCYLNGQPYDDFIKADYMLRALKVPAGKDMKLEMRFEPRSWIVGNRYGLIASILTILFFVVGVYFRYKEA